MCKKINQRVSSVNWRMLGLSGDVLLELVIDDNPITMGLDARATIKDALTQ